MTPPSAAGGDHTARCPRCGGVVATARGEEITFDYRRGGRKRRASVVMKTANARESINEDGGRATAYRYDGGGSVEPAQEITLTLRDTLANAAHFKAYCQGECRTAYAVEDVVSTIRNAMRTGKRSRKVIARPGTL